MMSVSRGVPCLKPNDWTVTCCLLEARYSKLGSIARRRSWIDRSEVSMTTSADSLRFATRARSRSMPTSRVPDPWSGWVRRRLSKRLMRTSSRASMKRTSGLSPSVSSWDMTTSRPKEKSSDLTSDTSATLSTGEVSAAQNSKNCTTSCGGRFWETYHPMSSSTRAAELRPAPDMPVMMTGGISVTGSILRGASAIIPPF